MRFAINNHRTIQFMMHNDCPNITSFLSGIGQGLKSKNVFHFRPPKDVHASLVKGWLDRHRDTIEIFYLPAY
jgi:hypothetical protein